MKLTTFFVVHRPRLRLSNESLARCQTIYELLEHKHAWSWLYSEGMLRKVDLLLALYVETVDVLLTLGEHFIGQYLELL